MALPLKFMTAVVRKADVDGYYPGGCAAFEARHTPALQDEALYGLVSMRWADVEDLLDQLYLDGLNPDIFVAVADMGLGPVQHARGISFVVNHDHFPPVWKAECSDEPVEPPVLPQQPIPASSLHYRPRDYFCRLDLEAELLTRVKGLARREAIKDALEKGEIDRLPEHIKDAELDNEERQRIGHMHPVFMGGEYLPRLADGEVEIARISIRSTTYDVTALYARRRDGRIHYRVVDEYETETLGDVTTLTSIRPLPMGRMVDFFISAWDMMAVLEENFGDDVDGMLDFFSGESEFYPCFDAALRERVEERFAKEEAEDDDALGMSEDMVATRLTPALLSAIALDDSLAARQLARQRILATPAWWHHVTLVFNEPDLPEQLRERLARFAATLRPASGTMAGMARGHKLARLRGLAMLCWRLHGDIPDARRLKMLFDAL